MSRRIKKSTVLWIVGLIGVLVLFGLLGWNSFDEERFSELQEEHTYIGTVTAIVYNEYSDSSKVWFNDNPGTVKIRGDVELVVGEVYKIVVDGGLNLINASILQVGG